MKKILTILVLTFVLTSCGVVERMFASVTGGGTATCFRGVTYVQFTSGAVMARNTDDTIMLCDD